MQDNSGQSGGLSQSRLQAAAAYGFSALVRNKPMP